MVIFTCHSSLPQMSNGAPLRCYLISEICHHNSDWRFCDVNISSPWCHEPTTQAFITIQLSYTVISHTPTRQINWLISAWHFTNKMCKLYLPNEPAKSAISSATWWGKPFEIGLFHTHSHEQEICHQPGLVCFAICVWFNIWQASQWEPALTVQHVLHTRLSTAQH